MKNIYSEISLLNRNYYTKFGTLKLKTKPINKNEKNLYNYFNTVMYISIRTN